MSMSHLHGWPTIRCYSRDQFSQVPSTEKLIPWICCLCPFLTQTNTQPLLPLECLAEKYSFCCPQALLCTLLQNCSLPSPITIVAWRFYLLAQDVVLEIFLTSWNSHCFTLLWPLWTAALPSRLSAAPPSRLSAAPSLLPYEISPGAWLKVCSLLSSRLLLKI